MLEVDKEAELSALLDAYETARFADDKTQIADFLPERQHPLYFAALREMIRIDLELCWDRGQARSIADYVDTFPEVLQDAETLRDITFEEYRLRLQTGDAVSPSEYRQRWGVDTDSWPVVTKPDKDEDDRAVARWDSTDQLSKTAAIYLKLKAPSPSTCDVSARLQKWKQESGHDAHVQLFHDLHKTDQQAAEDLALALTTVWEPGQTFLQFELVELLGEGAFGKVFLARQDELAGRLVALKISPRLFHESQTLAQLQHTNIVPIYSVHRLGTLQAVCMPFLGRATLAMVLKRTQGLTYLPRSAKFIVETIRSANREDGHRLCGLLRELDTMSLEEAVLEIGARLASGLAHAHERGIVHGDVKPANILLSGDAEPMLLDFNLSADIKLRSNLPAAIIGGTLPYMAPEQMRAVVRQSRHWDGRSDLFSLGVILYELLTGRHPFPSQSTDAEIDAILKQREQMPVRPRQWDKSIAPATEAIVLKCLHPDPKQRYQSARELEADLRRQREHRPLAYAPEPSFVERCQKWGRRHPRFAVGMMVGSFFAVLLLVLSSLYVFRGIQLARREAEHALLQTSREIRATQLVFAHRRTVDADAIDAVLDRADSLLANPYVKEEDSQRLRRELVHLLLYSAQLAASQDDDDKSIRRALKWNRRIDDYVADSPMPALVLRQRASLLAKLGLPAEQTEAREPAPSPVDADDLALSAAANYCRGQFAEAIDRLETALRHRPQDFLLWFDLGMCSERLGDDARAAACYSTCIALDADFAGLYFKRGIVHLRLQKHQAAKLDFDSALALHQKEATLPQRFVPELYLHRGLALLHLNRLEDALADLNQALQYRHCPTRAYFIRAHIHRLRGDETAYRRDHERGLEAIPQDEMSWVARGLARIESDPRGALADFEQALSHDAQSLVALQNKAYVLAEHLRETEKALAVVEELVRLQPQNAEHLGVRGVLHARLGHRRAAHRDAETILKLDAHPKTLYHAACIYALTSKQEPADSGKALLFLLSALQRGYGQTRVDHDPDLAPIRGLPDFHRIRELAAKN
ncbi:MAG: hypothetical protein KatS3mg105_3025 [Gemmatales bacterium]|nr:MAG: hypothetical protein KatS3mg105_3025 [Gemmatales bacterium]